ncbi:GldG family protein [Candidatus Binatia bacterium]|nr:GldG family protein [Candidatus Binatia bacterium]
MTSKRQWAPTQTVRHWLRLAIQIALAAVLCGLINLWAERHNRRFDLTPTQSYVLSDAATAVARGLTGPVRITGFYNSQEPGQRRQMLDVLGLFAAASPHITYRLEDLDRSPALAKKYGISNFNSGVVERGQDVRAVRSINEEEITGALLKLTRPETRTLCFVTGHGERRPGDVSDRIGYSEVGKALQRENYEIRSIDFVPPEGPPPDCTVLIIAGPQRDFLPGEAASIERYLDTGGRVMLLVDPQAPASIVELLARNGVRAGDDIVVDERNRFYGADSFMPRVPIFDEGTFRKNLDTAAVFSLARTVTPLDSARDGYRALLLAMTSPESYARIDGGDVPEGTGKFRPDTDKPGPLPVGAIVTGQPADGGPGTETPTPATRGQMIVFGDSDFPSNLYLNLLGNKDLFMSSVGVLAEDPELVAVRRKGLPRSSLSPVSLTAEQGRLIFWMAVVVLPGFFAVLGIVITWRRQRRSTVSA